MIHLEDHQEGVILPVRAMPGSKKNEVRGEQNGCLKVCVTQIPERGKATKAVLIQLAESLGLKKSQIELFAGETSQQKKFLIRGIDRTTLERIIGSLL
jgi:uncharacterized protein YggU (UPF0235/DUF167 family)